MSEIQGPRPASKVKVLDGQSLPYTPNAPNIAPTQPRATVGQNPPYSAGSALLNEVDVEVAEEPVNEPVPPPVRFAPFG